MQETKAWARAQGKKLKAFLKSQGVELPHKQCLEAVAAMHGSKNWQTFEASADADIEVRDETALHALAETALQAVMFEALPEGQTLSTLKNSLMEAAAAEEAGEEWQPQKHRMNAIWEGVEERDLMVPPCNLPPVIDKALAAVHTALRAKLLDDKSESGVIPVLVHRMVDWRVADGEGDNMPETDRRTYALSVNVVGTHVQANLAYPHSKPQSLDIRSPQLGIGMEINEGLPCAHVYADVYDGDALMSIFAARNGELLVRFNDQPGTVKGHPLYDKLGLQEGGVVLKARQIFD